MHAHTGMFGRLISIRSWYFPPQKQFLLPQTYIGGFVKKHSEKVFQKGQLSRKLQNILIFLNYGTGTKEINRS